MSGDCEECGEHAVDCECEQTDKDFPLLTKEEVDCYQLLRAVKQILDARDDSNQPVSMSNLDDACDECLCKLYTCIGTRVVKKALGVYI